VVVGKEKEEEGKGKEGGKERERGKGKEGNFQPLLNFSSVCPCIVQLTTASY